MSTYSEGLFDLAGKQKKIDDLQALMASPGFWDHQEKAQSVAAELRALNANVKPLKQLVSAADDLGVLLEFVEAESSPQTLAEMQQAIADLEPQLEAAELKAMLGEPEDSCGVYLQVQAGEGGTDAADWAHMLLRMYLRWAERHGYEVEEIDLSPGEEAGIRNATIAIRGDYAFGYLKGEEGNHRLIRISPFDAAARRQTSFAAVDVTPELSDDFDIDVDFDDPKIIREDVFRASGAGGQKVNKTSSAIRLTHIPTGVVVQCQNERSQHKNRALAEKMLKAKLYQLEKDKRDQEVAAKRGMKSRIGFGGETIRHYVLNPEQYVKDARSGHKHGNPNAVLDGELDGFIEKYMRWSMGKED